MSVTERDIYFSTHPQLLLSPWSRNQLEAWFGPSTRSEDRSTYVEELINDINAKYRRLDLIKWDPHVEAFYDYYLGKVISIDGVNGNFDQYPPMTLQKLGEQLAISLPRWTQSNLNVKAFQDLYNRIQERLRYIAQIEAIVE